MESLCQCVVYGSSTVMANDCSDADTDMYSFQLHGDGKKSVPQLKVLFSFYTTTVIGVLESGTVTERVLSSLLPPLSEGLKSKMSEHKAASYIILAQLLHKAKLEPSLLKILMLSLTKVLVQS